LKTKVLIADDHGITREGLKALLERSGDLEVVAQAACGRDAVRLALQHRPALVIIDVSMQEMSGIEAARQIHAELPRARIIALSMHKDQHFVDGMLLAGASGYVLKESAFAELLQAITTVLADGSWLSPPIAARVTRDYVQHLSAEDSASPRSLTPRENEVIQLVAEGFTTREIGARLFISAKTVDTHRQQIRKKVGLSSVAELTKFAIREGLTSLE
jgi:DNA-binding NarL/FixJ family response regulator